MWPLPCCDDLALLKKYPFIIQFVWSEYHNPAYNISVPWQNNGYIFMQLQRLSQTIYFCSICFWENLCVMSLFFCATHFMWFLVLVFSLTHHVKSYFLLLVTAGCMSRWALQQLVKSAALTSLHYKTPKSCRAELWLGNPPPTTTTWSPKPYNSLILAGESWPAGHSWCPRKDLNCPVDWLAN